MARDPTLSCGLVAAHTSTAARKRLCVSHTSSIHTARNGCVYAVCINHTSSGAPINCESHRRPARQLFAAHCMTRAVFSSKKISVNESFFKKKNQKRPKRKDCLQHPVFPCGPPPEYYLDPTQLNFTVRMGCGAFCVVWPKAIAKGSKIYLNIIILLIVNFFLVLEFPNLEFPNLEFHFASKER